MKGLVLGIVALSVVTIAAAGTRAEAQAQPDRSLQPPGDFAGIRNDADRSKALFVEAGKVLLHPRCVNCHPAGDRPLQGNGYPHQPRVQRGDETGQGVTTMRCTTCHGNANFDPGRVPGDPAWSLARKTMAWQGRSLGQICEQVKDPERNNQPSFQAVVDHMKHHSLVGWAWNPGVGREKAPGTWEEFRALISAWAESGAHCPSP